MIAGWVRVARVVREFPAAVSYLREGRLHVSAVVQLAPKLTADNHQTLLDRASGKSCAEIREVLAELFPRPDVATLIRRKPRTRASQTGTVLAVPPPVPPPGSPPVPDVKRVPVTATSEAAGAVEPAPDDEREELDLAGGGQAGPGAPAELKLKAPVDRGRVEPLSAERFSVRFTASGTLVGKLNELKALLAHTVRGGDLGEMLELAVDELLARKRKERFGTAVSPSELELKPSGPAPAPPAAAPREVNAPEVTPEAPTRETSRYIPVAIRREVYQRDRGRCTYAGPDGHPCGAQDVEFDHVQPYALGGRHTVEGLRLRCRVHNLHAAREAFGEHSIDARIRQARELRRPQGGPRGRVA